MGWEICLYQNLIKVSFWDQQCIGRFSTSSLKRCNKICHFNVINWWSYYVAIE